jgi:pimeloyl-ACP methyl ester carboxylesterase
MLERTLGLGALIADVERIRRITGDDRAIVAGHSFGGLLAALYAAEFPYHVAALVLIDPASVLKMPAPGGDPFTQVRDRLPAGARDGYDHWLKGTFDLPAAIERLPPLQQELVRYVMLQPGKQRPSYAYVNERWGLAKAEFDVALAEAYGTVRRYLRQNGLEGAGDMKFRLLRGICG